MYTISLEVLFVLAIVLAITTGINYADLKCCIGTKVQGLF